MYPPIVFPYMKLLLVKINSEGLNLKFTEYTKARQSRIRMFSKIEKLVRIITK